MSLFDPPGGVEFFYQVIIKSMTHLIINHYQSNISKSLIIKPFDNEAPLYLIIKGLDDQAQKLNNQINQYPQKSLISALGPNLP